MVIRVLFFGALKDVIGRGEESLPLKDGDTVADVLAAYRLSHPALEKWVPSLAVSVNQQYSSASTALKAGDEVAFLPPVSGGSAGLSAVNRCAIVRSPIDTRALVAALQSPEDGAVVVFEGVVRNHTRNRRTLYLDYEAYEAMALAKLETLRGEARRTFAVRDIAIVHRIGRLEIGEASVVIVVASAHRAAAFDACRWVIDTLKRSVPIWKKEYFEDGAVWADGEPFPPDIAAPPPRERK
jgi:molybdopterin synthase catalytic subunit